ncbi:MAG: DNA polymerase III subunit delta' [bacterium]
MIIGHQKIIDFLSRSIKTGRMAHAYLFAGPPKVGKKIVAFEFIKALLCQNAADGSGACERAERVSSHAERGGKCRNCLLIEQGRHPDVLFVVPGGESSKAAINGEKEEEQVKNKEIKIGQIRELQHQLNLTPFSATKKVIIIDEADKMTQEAANCLLKTLEEPPQKSLLILITSRPQALLATIVSRCQLIKFLPVKENLIAEGLKKLGAGNDKKIKQAARLSAGRPGAAVSLLNEDEAWQRQEKLVDDLKYLIKKDFSERFRYAQKMAQNTPEAQEALGQWLVWFRDQMLAGVGAKNLTILEEKSGLYPFSKICVLIKNIQETQRLLGESSFNARLILENLLLKF